MEGKLQTFCTVFLVCFYILTTHKRVSCVPYGYELASYGDGPEEMPMMESMPDKRGMCRSGFTYSAILRNCIPSLGVLRNRGRAGRGRRGLSPLLF